MNKTILVALGIMIIIEAIVAIFWKWNDKRIIGITARVFRIVAGVAIIVIGIELNNG